MDNIYGERMLYMAAEIPMPRSSKQEAELSGDTILITERDIITGDSWGSAIPRVPASDPKYVKHVVCEGARFHIISYSSQGRKCSEPDCIVNKPSVLTHTAETKQAEDGPPRQLPESSTSNNSPKAEED